MKRILCLGLAVAAVLCGVMHLAPRDARAAVDQAAPPRHSFTPDQIPFGPVPPFLNPGAQLAVLEGDPTALSGEYTVRLKMPDGYRIAPHFHPLRENVTVISGTFKLGMGDEFEVHKMSAFTVGSFAFLDPNMHHYAMACGETIVQVHGLSPLQFNYINPSDDPSNHHR